MKKYSILLVALLLVAAGCEGLLGNLGDAENQLPPQLRSLLSGFGVSDEELANLNPAQAQEMMGTKYKAYTTASPAAANPTKEQPLVLTKVSITVDGKEVMGVISDSMQDPAANGGTVFPEGGTTLFIGPKFDTKNYSLEDAFTVTVTTEGKELDSGDASIKALPDNQRKFLFWPSDGPPNGSIADLGGGIFDIGYIELKASIGSAGRTYPILWMFE